MDIFHIIRSTHSARRATRQQNATRRNPATAARFAQTITLDPRCRPPAKGTRRPITLRRPSLGRG